ncbi:MAG TPA: heavy-metal-associated domain-containing protein [Burkholderiaceae bacterium]|jgi:Cu+-exporting ATPase|nr:heavy-metal-associated domain-containing protein [Burkholderiaceae bacterium]
MQQVFEISGMHCGGCVNRVTKALTTLAATVTVTLEPPRATFEVAAPLPLEAVNAALAKAGDYEARPL